MNADLMQGRAGYEWVTRQVVTQQSWVLLWKNDLDVFCKKSIAHSAGPVYIQVQQLETKARVGLGTHRGLRLLYVRTQCMLIWVAESQVLGSRVLRSPGPWVLGPWGTLNLASCLVTHLVLLSWYVACILWLFNVFILYTRVYRTALHRYHFVVT